MTAKHVRTATEFLTPIQRPARELAEEVIATMRKLWRRDPFVYAAIASSLTPLDGSTRAEVRIAIPTNKREAMKKLRRSAHVMKLDAVALSAGLRIGSEPPPPEASSKRNSLRAQVLKTLDLALEADDPEALRQMLLHLALHSPKSDLAVLVRAAIIYTSDSGLEVLAGEAIEQEAQTREVISEMAREDEKRLEEAS